MGALDNEIMQSIKTYFNALSKLGYLKYDSVYKLLVYIFLNKLIKSDCISYLSTEDYKEVSNLLQCLYGNTCLISYPTTEVFSSSNCTKK